MGREVRMVPKNWKHPRKENGDYEPLLVGYKHDKEEFEKKFKNEGLQEAIDYYGQAPDKNDYMSDWPDEEKTHFQMYESTSEGTPISPVMKTPETLARWLANNSASSFASNTATYEQWLSTIKRGSAVSAVMTVKDGLKSGVEAMI